MTNVVNLPNSDHGSVSYRIAMRSGPSMNTKTEENNIKKDSNGMPTCYSLPSQQSIEQ